jgi:hypothetical protein
LEKRQEDLETQWQALQERMRQLANTNATKVTEIKVFVTSKKYRGYPVLAYGNN